LVENQFMTDTVNTNEIAAAPWDEEHVKALLNFPRYPVRLIQEEPWQSWVSQRGGLKAVYDFLRNYALSPSHRRILDVVLANPEEIADVYAGHLNISRATYFYRLRELLPAVVHPTLPPLPKRLAHRTHQRYLLLSPLWSAQNRSLSILLHSFYRKMYVC
jgi:hypothetical protein